MLTTKSCNQCKEIKTLDKFNNHPRGLLKKQSKCKSCQNENTKRFFKTKDGVPIRIYGAQVQSSKKRGFTPPSYTNKELKEWMLSQKNFDQLYENWVNSGYEKDYSLSCDRIDDYKPYSLDNIQLVTWLSNQKNFHNDRVNGINNKQSRSVIQYTIDGLFIKEYYSLCSASRETGLWQGNITATCQGKHAHCGGFIWRYKT